MERVLDRLWIGSTRDATAPLASLGFVGLLDLRDGQLVRPVEGVQVHRVGNRDGDPWSEAQVEEAVDFISDWIRSGKVLVVCAAGMSRSASMVIGYLVRSGWSPAEAHERVREARAKIAPVERMLTSVLSVVHP